MWAGTTRKQGGCENGTSCRSPVSGAASSLLILGNLCHLSVPQFPLPQGRVVVPFLITLSTSVCVKHLELRALFAQGKC